MDVEGALAVVVALLIGVGAAAAWVATRQMSRMREEALEREGEWLEEEVRRASMTPPPPSSLRPVEFDVVMAQIDLERKKEILRRSSVPPVPGPGYVPPGYVPPPPREIMEAAERFRLSQVPPAVPPPPGFVLPKPPKLPKV